MAVAVPIITALIAAAAQVASQPNGTNTLQTAAQPGAGATPNNQQPSPFSMANAAPEPGQADVAPPDQIQPPAQNVPQNATIGDILAATPTQAQQAPQNAGAAAAPTNGSQPTSQQIMEGIGAALRNPAVLQMLGFGPHDQRVTVLPAAAGSHGGQLVPGYNLPGHVSIGEILNSLPRARYGA